MTAAMTADDWIAALELAPHPEGGHFRRIWTAPGAVATPAGERPRTSAIYYLLTAASPVGRFHRNASEILHVLVAGGPVDYSFIDPHGAWHEHTLTRAPRPALHLVCPGEWWKGTHLRPGVDHALVVESVSPGFDYADHTMADHDLFMRLFPQHRSRWARLVNSPG
jgi:predicted cupin superfamily sugar epimerase